MHQQRMFAICPGKTERDRTGDGFIFLSADTLTSERCVGPFRQKRPDCNGISRGCRNNFDAVGRSDWKNRNGKTIILSVCVADNDADHSIVCRLKHKTVLACLATAGDASTAIIISHPVEYSLWMNYLHRKRPGMIWRKISLYLRQAFLCRCIHSVCSMSQYYQINGNSLKHQGVFLMDFVVTDIFPRILQIRGKILVAVILFLPYATIFVSGSGSVSLQWIETLNKLHLAVIRMNY
jgi:hypothetical protein